MRDISYKAVIISSVFNFVLMTLLIVVLGAIYGANLKSSDSGMSDNDIAIAFASSWTQYIALIAPLAAGYLAASIAKRRPYLHSLLSSSLNVLWGIVCMAFLMPVTPMIVFMVLINMALGLVGGWLWVKRSAYA
ncbi:MAG: hypothetical protein ACOH12_15240 [Parvibaculaceae bacterium]